MLKSAIATTNLTDITNTPTSIKIQRFAVGLGTSYFDSIRIREFISTEPYVATALTEEYITEPVWCNLCSY